MQHIWALGIHDSKYERIRSYMNSHILDYTWTYKNHILARMCLHMLMCNHIYSYTIPYTTIYDDRQSYKHAYDPICVHMCPYMPLCIAIYTHIWPHRNIYGRMLGQIWSYMDINNRILHRKWINMIIYAHIW